MGFFSGLSNIVSNVVSGVSKVASSIAPLTSFVPGPVGTVSRALTAFGGASAGGLSRTPGIAPSSFTPTKLTLPRAGGRTSRSAGLMDLLPDIGVPGPGVFSSAGCPPGFHLAKDGSGRCVRNRRMNPLNHKANMRAARRLVAFRKAVVRTEKALRKAVPPSARRRAPAGHRARLTHQ